jgi:lipid-A-disaccharide synthase
VKAAGIGGPKLRAAGLDVVQPMESIAVMGFASVLGKLPEIRRARRGILRLLAEHPDAVFVPIDAPGLHLGLARRAKRMGRRVVYYVCPQIWAWGGGRIQRLREDVDVMLHLFSFESKLLRDAGLDARWVGHPAGALAPDPAGRTAAKETFGIGPTEKVVALLPGSRREEVRRHLGPMLDAAARVSAHIGGRARAIVSDAGQVDAALRLPALRRDWEILAPLRWGGDVKDLLRAADAAVVASGTATLETAALGVPQVIVYKTGRLNYEIARRLVRVPSIGLANLVAERSAAPELIQRDVTGPRIAAELAKLLTDEGAREAQLHAFASIPERLGGPGSAERAARALMDFVQAGRTL